MNGPLPATLDLFNSRGPFTCYGQTSVPCRRSVFLRQHPEWTCLLKRASHADHILFNVRISSSRARPFFVRADHFCHGRTSVPRTRTVFIYQNPIGLLCLLELRKAEHSLLERTFFYCLRGTREEYPINIRTSARRFAPLSFARTIYMFRAELYLLWADLCPPYADCFHSPGK
jgi:hypothetical protein